ncbi:secreted protein [Melampsora americana]|nr:secreted protein [Melampsora americana]
MASTSPVEIAANPMIPGVGAHTGEEFNDQLSTLPEDSEEHVFDGQRNSSEPLLEPSTSEDFDDEIPRSIHGIEGTIPMSQMGDDENTDNGDSIIPSVLFMIPFPAPVNGRRSKSTTPFLLYTPPRSVYSKPPKGEDGKRPKEKILKRVVRHYQQEVRFGEQIKRREVPKTGKFYRLQKIRGGCIRGANMLTKWLPSPCVETLARLPPKSKLGEVTVFFPTYSGEPRPDEEDQPYQPTEEELRHDINVLLRRTRRRVLVRLIIAGAFMPIAIGIDFFAPAFSVEITLAYLAFQVYGWRKVKTLTSAAKKNKKPKSSKKTKKSKKAQKAIEAGASTGEVINAAPGASEDVSNEVSEDGPELFRITPANQAIFDPLISLMYNICHRIDPLTFPALQETAVVVESPAQVTPVSQDGDTQPSRERTKLQPTLHKPGPEVVREMLAAFRASLPEELLERHILDEERVSEDLARYMKKAAAEYVWSLKGRPERSPIKVTRKWIAKRKTVHQERKQRAQVKKQIKKEAAEDLINAPAEEQDATALPEAEVPLLSDQTPVSNVESKREKKERLAREKKEAKEMMAQEKAEFREQARKAKLEKLAIRQAKKDKKKAE